ncbi:E2/UBC family protein [Klebsiella pneumoniae]|uniref:E2/UBC family protein n=1 Tax=Klebsiella/Raoultella group TaxID=2890311 RepID=UPI00190CFCE3|nr:MULTISPECIES: E2/UBC family protein [Klebsiella/Raoultella group]ELT7633641.1 ThiF family adenylyltransferase [Klebsiella pneumoniae]MCG0525775.1 ThiF family adenylyltransferase [Klebsiella pneumoniae]MDH1513366.1 ThiF family adenylyltransferase [Klebsiella pneumoniae]HBQ3910980.1 ThiF family adenylyltransferase [Klebsiella pneumoniae]HBR1763924.1 ThiF family adenylyltransferase [Klebsiella pneumoniae]
MDQIQVRQIHQVLLGCGFRYTNARDISPDSALRLLYSAAGFYVKSYVTSAGTFDVAIVLKDELLTTLPAAIILQSPEQLKGRLLPHINMGWYLCYVEEKEATWDPNDLEGLLRSVDIQIGLTLNNSVNAVETGLAVDAEMEGEFSSYWLARHTAYLVADVTQQKEFNCFVAGKKNAHKTEYQEWVVCDDTTLEERDAWLSQRKLELHDSRGIITRRIRIKPSQLSGVTWPPKTFRAVLDWLAEVDNVAWLHLLEHFIQHPVKRHMILMDVLHQDMVGFRVDLDLGALALSSYQSSSVRRQRKAGRVNYAHLASAVSSKQAVQKFQRVNVVQADRLSVLSRNRRGKESGDLSTKHIALIGCGTIGGYLAGLLLRAGAGCGDKTFHLFDHDEFQPINFGRHVLATTDIGRNKAEALVFTLNSSTHLAKNIKAFTSRFAINAEQLKRYDIVIDATGRPPVSARLASVVRTLKLTERPVLIHGFNDGNGRASKVIIDDGSCCYGCLFANEAFYKGGMDLRFNHISMSAERHISCGSTFTPYDAAVSIITAGIMQEAALSVLEKNARWTYSEHILEGGRTQKQKLLAAHPRCGICHGNL